MANMHAIEKKLFSVQLPQRLYRQLEKCANAENIPINTYLVRIVTEYVGSMPLTDDDEVIILERIQDAISKRLANKNKKESK